MKKQLMAVALALFLASVRDGKAATIVLSDGDFSNADYATQTAGSVTVNNNFSTAGTSVPVGGNPGAFRQISNFAQNFGNDLEIVYGWHFNTAQPYDPADGEILSVDYSEDSLFISGGTHRGHLAVRQDGVLFRSKPSFTTGVSNTSFTNNQLNGLTAGDFEGFFNGTFFPTAIPDFTASGSPLEFGFIRFSSSRDGVGDSSGIDNWKVTLTTVVPEPLSASLLFSSLLIASCQRRR